MQGSRREAENPRPTRERERVTPRGRGHDREKAEEEREAPTGSRGEDRQESKRDGGAERKNTKARAIALLKGESPWRGQDAGRGKRDPRAKRGGRVRSHFPPWGPREAAARPGLCTTSPRGIVANPGGVQSLHSFCSAPLAASLRAVRSACVSPSARGRCPGEVS